MEVMARTPSTQLAVVKPAQQISTAVVDIKSDNFKRLAAQRVEQVFEALRRIESLSNKYNYNFTDEEVDHIYHSIAQKMVEGRKRFSPGFKKFSFNDM